MRVEIRDYVDLYWLQSSGLPLGTLAWAAPAKEPEFTPRSLVERLSFHLHLLPKGFGDTIVLEDIDESRVKRVLVAAIDDARDWIGRMPSEQAPCLYMRDGRVVARPDPAAAAAGAYERVVPKEGGAWPSTPETESFLLRKAFAAKDPPLIG